VNLEHAYIYREAERESQFILGVTKDFVHFTMIFIAAVMYTDLFYHDKGHKLLTTQQIHNLIKLARKFNPEMNSFLNGTLSTSKMFRNIFESFRARNEIYHSNFPFPSSDEIQQAASFNNVAPFLDRNIRAEFHTAPLPPAVETDYLLRSQSSENLMQSLDIEAALDPNDSLDKVEAQTSSIIPMEHETSLPYLCFFLIATTCIVFNFCLDAEFGNNKQIMLLESTSEI